MVMATASTMITLMLVGVRGATVITVVITSGQSEKTQ